MKNYKKDFSDKTSHSSSSKLNVFTRKRIWQRVLIALFLSAGIIFAQKAGWLDQFSRQLTQQHMNWSNNSDVIAYLKKIVANNQLTKTSPHCLVYVINNDNGQETVRVEVREQHNSVCTNTRKDFPLLFTFEINRIQKTVQIDKGSPNHFYPIQ
ncbi:hypothetical protein COMNV_00276 [Commensalibacter sp. Nvir]|uniref:hypothetical protein n=1 Tax=Commensalibacter sp. Nvir TaxID=3069817 RepID=UPI002D3B0C59|nr:hypothetical protein COMNV_00276 [Commensalibacter sp. Nvir]